ncbi:hypothetical protein LRAMOSA09701 [Lichtheimia ramosa]|uniref:Uncharacterized protein n=1 Tax=Lichtheimia ramosa TaxID=688394 RepID=A0A077WJE4_9FUNG|nr:hypothetical protein LRAMOSA09701 [Lichtheimia ramosa]
MQSHAMEQQNVLQTATQNDHQAPSQQVTGATTGADIGQQYHHGSNQRRPTADPNAFLGYDTEGRRNSEHGQLKPTDRAKQLAAEMKEKLKYRKQQNIPEPHKQLSIGGKVVPLE